MCACTLQFVFPSLLKLALIIGTNTGIIYSKEITTTTNITANKKVNANSGPGLVIQTIGQGQ